MIPKQTLIATIEEFDRRFQEVSEECRNAKEAGECHSKYFMMNKAWSKLQDAVEFNLLIFTETP